MCFINRLPKKKKSPRKIYILYQCEPLLTCKYKNVAFTDLTEIFDLFKILFYIDYPLKSVRIDKLFHTDRIGIGQFNRSYSEAMKIHSILRLSACTILWNLFRVFDGIHLLTRFDGRLLNVSKFLWSVHQGHVFHWCGRGNSILKGILLPHQ